MTKEQFKALPESQQERIMVENKRRAATKYKKGEKQIEQLLAGGLADRTAVAERIPALKAALGMAGLSASDFVQAFHAYHHATIYVMKEENILKAYARCRPEPGMTMSA